MQRWNCVDFFFPCSLALDEPYMLVVLKALQLFKSILEKKNNQVLRT